MSFEHRVKHGHTVVAYLLSGSGRFDDRQRSVLPTSTPASAGWILSGAAHSVRKRLVLYEREGDVIRVTAGENGVRFLLLAGRPLGEPVAWQGPIVMNSREELRLAFEEYNNGTFIK